MSDKTLPDGDDLHDAKSLVQILDEKHRRLLAHLCAFVCVERALAKFADMSPIRTIDPVSDDVARFVIGERPGTSFLDALDIVSSMSTVIVQDDVIAKFMKYDRNMII